MTSIVIAPRVEDLTSDTEAVASGGWFRIRPARAYKAGGQWVHPVWPASVTPLNGSAVTVKLDPIADVPYELELSIPDGNGGSYHPPNEFRYVTASASPLNWEDLIQEGGPGVGAALPGSAEARLLALETLYSTLSGGASTLAGITDMTAVARSLNGKATTATMLAFLNAPAIGDAPTAHTHVATTDLTATGTKNTTTFLRGDNTWAAPPTAGSPAWTDITGKPTTFAPSAHTHPASDITGLVATGVDWLNITNRPHERFEIVCTGDVQLPRNYPNVTPATPVRTQDSVDWVKATAPSVSVAQVGDGWWLDV